MLAEPQPEKHKTSSHDESYQLADFGTDQCLMMTGHYSKIRTRWSNATHCEDQPSNEIKCLRVHERSSPSFVQDSTQGACERAANEMVTKMTEAATKKSPA